MPDSRRVICHRECTPPSATRARIVWRSGVISMWVPCNPRWAAQLSPSSHPSNRPIRRLRGSGMPRPPPIPAALQAGPSILRARGRAAGRLRRPAARAVLHGALSLRARPCGRRRSLCTAAFCASVMAALGRSTTIPAASRRHLGRPQRRHAPLAPASRAPAAPACLRLPPPSKSHTARRRGRISDAGRHRPRDLNVHFAASPSASFIAYAGAGSKHAAGWWHQSG